MGRRICVWGDSISHGAHDFEKGGWVERLKTSYTMEDDISVYNVGISGDTTHDVLERFDVEAKAREPEMIVFSIGINDAIYIIDEDRHKNTEEGFRDNIKKLIAKSKIFTDKILLLSCNPVDQDKTTPISWDKNKEYHNSYIQKLNKIIEEIALEEGLLFVDIYKVFIERQNYIDLLPDGLHPNEDGHELIFQVVKENIKL